MKIKKIGHCCLVIEIKGKRIITDPGSYTESEQKLEKNIDLILITHEHQDHLHIDSLKEILKNNPNVKIITNSGVGKILDDVGIKYEKLENGNSGEFASVFLEGFGNEHAEIYKDVSRVQNTGYFIENKLFYPGDNFTDPKKEIDILALPVLAPWMSLKEAIDYAIKLKPRKCFPVHDWNMKIPGATHRVPENVLRDENIEFKILEANKEEEF